MKEDIEIDSSHAIAPGEIWAVGTPSAASARDWCAGIAGRDALAGRVALASFSQQAATMQATGWPQARYYSDGGIAVREALSYDSVWEVNPFEVGAKRPETRASFKIRMGALMRLFAMDGLKESPLIALSNGEMRRFLIARAAARRPDLLILDDPSAGLDPGWREKLKGAVEALARRGMAVIWAWRHEDELPAGVTRRFVLRGGRLALAPSPPAVLEINNLNISFGRRVLFRNFCWTVRRGERWILRGGNGTGKTTLFALATGDSPLAYAADVRVFGQRREAGAELAKTRRRIALASPELQAASGLSADELLDRALSRKCDLLLLDEPFMNMTPRAAREAAGRISGYLDARPGASAILISHRRDETPRGFDRVMELK
ncbi:MAG: ATP-binding cassette domain-containing protein [Kiritimatiellae bacterium]|nr:ATP-binding cassette domain-containing protein [Kiritimatiellia bacterium]